MPEGDTVFLAATRLHAALAGQRHLLLRIGGGVTLHTHYKMNGSWHLYRPGERWRGPSWQVRVLLVSKLPAIRDLSVSHLRPLRSAACSR